MSALCLRTNLFDATIPNPFGKPPLHFIFEIWIVCHCEVTSNEYR
jgi:hypothetical protein